VAVVLGLELPAFTALIAASMVGSMFHSALATTVSGYLSWVLITLPMASTLRSLAASTDAEALGALTALSPLDGRYAAKVAPLRPLLSEFGLMHRRVQVEVEWFIALSDAGFAEFKPLSEAARGLLRGLVLRFSRPTRRPSRTSSDHQPRRQGGGVLAQAALQGPAPSWRRPASSCTSPAPARTSTTPATR
jgi:hypothetical protein